MRRLALLLSLLLGAPVAWGDEPPPWMPAPPPRTTSQSEQRARELAREARIFGGVGLGLFSGGVVVGIIALDLPQGSSTVLHPDGTSTIERTRNDANWFELAGGLALLGTGIALVGMALYKAKQARRLLNE